MAQNRKPPAYQMYASDFMANRAYRVMSLPARGLLITMLNECWVNRNLPSNSSDLAKVLGYPANEVAESLPAVMAFFRVEGDDLICPELEDYRAHREGVRQAQSDGGKKGAGSTNEKRRGKKSDSAGASTPLGMPSSSPSSPEMRGVEQSRDERSKSVSRAGIHDDFIADYESGEADSASNYLRASRG